MKHFTDCISKRLRKSKIDESMVEVKCTATQNIIFLTFEASVEILNEALKSVCILRHHQKKKKKIKRCQSLRSSGLPVTVSEIQSPLAAFCLSAHLSNLLNTPESCTLHDSPCNQMLIQKWMPTSWTKLWNYKLFGTALPGCLQEKSSKLPQSQGLRG